MTLPALEVRRLHKQFVSPDGETVPIVDIESLELAPAQQAALVGRSGSGKTTLLHMIAGILRPDSGSIRIAGHELTTLSESQRDALRARHIGYIFQTFNLLQGYSALENVELAMRFGRGVQPGRARELLTRVGLEQRLHYRPRQLSVGQQQRVAVARALAGKPTLVLADEPTGNLDAAHADAALGLIREICREQGAALLLVSHDPAILARFETVWQLDELNQAAAAHARSAP